jgi:hypothetical protein
VVDVNRKLLVLILATVAVFIAAPLASAQEPPTLTAWTDKAEYGPGETGTLSFALYNSGSSALNIKKVTIVFDEWRAYRNGQWEGNQTIDVTPPLVVESKAAPYENSTKFTVPNDGRAQSTLVHITFYTVDTGIAASGTYSITVTTTPKFMDQIVTLFTVQIVLIIVCTVILAATIFLSARRPPQVTWSKEPE